MPEEQSEPQGLTGLEAARAELAKQQQSAVSTDMLPIQQNQPKSPPPPPPAHTPTPDAPKRPLTVADIIDSRQEQYAETLERGATGAGIPNLDPTSEQIAAGNAKEVVIRRDDVEAFNKERDAHIERMQAQFKEKGPVSSLGAVKCPTCGNDIFDNSPRIELAGALMRVSFDGKQKKLNQIVKNNAWCNIHCFNAFVTQL